MCVDLTLTAYHSSTELQTQCLAKLIKAIANHQLDTNLHNSGSSQFQSCHATHAECTVPHVLPHAMAVQEHTHTQPQHLGLPGVKAFIPSNPSLRSH